MRNIGRFLRRYKHFSAILLVGIIGLALQLTGQKEAARWLLSTAALLSCLPLLRDMWHDLRSGSYGIDILAITAIVTAVVMKEYWAAIVIVIMLTGGEALEDYAENRAKTELTALLKRAPQTATVLRGRKTQQVAARDVRVGDKIVHKPGEIVPVDPMVIDGGGNFDESALTGESLPVSKQTGDEILSGSANIDGAVTARCIRQAKDSQFERIVRLVRTASNSQAPFVRLADQYSIPFTIIAYAIAICAWLYSRDPRRFLEVIVVATPCPLLLAAPIAIISGMSRSSKQGIIVRTGGALERLAQARTIAFDKTGTLTKGQLTVDKVLAYSSHDENEVLAAAASLEQHSNHVLAHAIVDAAQEQGIKLAKVKQLRETAGQGLSAGFSGRQFAAGRLSYLEEQGVDTSDAGKAPDQTATYVAINGTLAGAITFRDSLREDSKPTIERLKRLGFRTVAMVTGDHKASARSVAAAVGIGKDYVTSGALPADKMHAIEALKPKPVVFVGDGVNDAPVLTASGVGIALGARGSTVASESADVVIMTDDIGKVATAATIARRTFKIARQSILIGIFISIGLMLVYATGKFSPLSGALVQELVDVIVIFNALRAHR